MIQSGTQSGTRCVVAALAACLAGLSGCSGAAAPKLSLASASVAERTEAGVVMNFEIEAKNTNEAELPLKEMRYTLRLNGREVFRGLRSPEATLRRLGTQRIRFPAVISAADAPSGPARYELRGTLEYTTPGQISLVLADLGLRRPTVGFEGQGNVDLTAVPAAPAAPVTPAVPAAEARP